MRLSDASDALERWSALDPLAGLLRRVVDAVLPGRRLRDALHGVWLGHPLHPALILLPLGNWVSAAVLDQLPGSERAARTLVGLGTATAVPAAAAGAVDWSQLHPAQQRVGVVHATANTVTLALNVASWLERRRGRHRRGARLSLAGLTVGAVGAYLGGHLSFRQASGANHAEEIPYVLPTEFTLLCRLDELPEGKPVQMVLEATPLFALRHGTGVTVLSDRCSHLAGPLHEGDIGESGGVPCVVCPWHGSTFRLTDGSVVHGPATAPQPVLDTRVAADGTVLVRVRGGS